MPTKKPTAKPLSKRTKATPPAPAPAPAEPIRRKPEGAHRSVAIRVLVTPAEQEALQRAAERAHLTLSSWARTVVLRAAEAPPDAG